MFCSVLHAVPCNDFICNLVKPFKNADAYATELRQLVKDPTLPCTKSFKELFSKDDAVSKDKQAKDLILYWYNKKIKLALAVVNGPTISVDEDPSITWDYLPWKKRFYWTLKHRSPYTYFSTLSKWGIETAIVLGSVKALHELKKRYDKQAHKGQ